MRICDSNGKWYVVDKRGNKRPYTPLDRLMDWGADWWSSRDWRRRQAEFKRTGTRYYGDGGTLHSGLGLDVETYKGRVVSVWFRCQTLPFKQTEVDQERAEEMDRMAAAYRTELHGVEVRDEDNSMRS